MPEGVVIVPVPLNIKLLGTTAVPALIVTSSHTAIHNIVFPVASREVNLPVLSAVLPIGPGVANLAVKPAPETNPEAERVVNTPAPVW